ncbi:MAG: hypothetical protein COW01_04775 [Bdellovibrionales bacterium CG12_big_fil_rev_8_21_14_0_65_38_15]|nr:MAG: hypothetical protein COW79_12095 [Bdellovibrionales bacterium CG22_combo_CG10-13_8_21_14_all_38_13]PIQ56371.1 MAG: hypothetical protein COW01_04775 [Bdellovibrionales bacterium CG12_big_fil_rev_8_21_14_0_65_38_15]PIR29402.1 MAG: hypothetical protein COV38_11710 [Bdellovibrionales bacterium CG11_big_fil_rev_8_21_14_0_20_38_13]
MKYLFIFISFAVSAQNTVKINSDDFSFDHPTCLLRFDEKQEFSTKLKENLIKKGFKLHGYIEEKKLNPEDLYMTLSISREGLFFKDCKLTIKINEATSSKILSTDKTLLQTVTTRAYPRVTFNGDERCTRGIDDLFVDLPSCKSGRSILK